MRKIALFVLLLIAAVGTARAYDYSGLVIQQTDGTEQTLNVESLTITFADGKLTAVNADGTFSFSLTDLTKMYFTAGSTGLNEARTAATVADTEAVDIYTLTGASMGHFDHFADARTALPAGAYIVKTKTETFKMIVR